MLVTKASSGAIDMSVRLFCLERQLSPAKESMSEGILIICQLRQTVT